MKPEWEQAYDDTMDVIRRRTDFCNKWREEVMLDARDGRISPEEALMEMERIKVEMDRTEDALERLRKTLGKWKKKD